MALAAPPRAHPAPLLMLAVLACSAESQEDVADRTAALDALRQEHVDAVNSRDADRVLAGMTSDVVYLAPGLEPVHGRAELEPVLRAAYEQFQPRISLIPKEVTVVRSFAYEWGCLAGEIEPLAGGDPAPNVGQYMLVYRWSESGGWAIARDIYNTSPCTTGAEEGDGPE